MLNLNAEIGTQLEVTFVQAFRCVITEERINGHYAYLHRDSISARPGDRCRVTIVDRLEGNGPTFLRVDEVIKAGDGVSSLREKTLLDIQAGWYSETNFEQTVIANLRSRCDGDAEMLEVLLDTLEFYSFTGGQHAGRRAVPLNYGHYCIVIARLINSLFADDAAKRVELYLRAAQYCAAHQNGSQWVESFRSVAETLKVD